MQSGIAFEKRGKTEIQIRDVVAGQQYRLSTSDSVDIQPASTDSFPVPVTDAITIRTTGIHTLDHYGLTIRDTDGGIADVCFARNDTSVYDRGAKILQIEAPVKTFVWIEEPFSYESTQDGISAHCQQPAEIVVGARKRNCYPQETIAVSDSPADLLEAVSHFGDAMLTTSPERSFPSLRGHPPKLVAGETLSVPEALSKPETGVTITVPPERSEILSVAPLAYYLLATVEPGAEFSVTTAGGLEYSPRGTDTAEAAATLLRHCFYLDCLVRTEGLYTVDLQERQEFEAVADVDLPYAELYDLPLSDRLERYLEVDRGTLQDVAPDWPVTALVEPDTDALEALPYLAYELAHVRTADPPRYSGNEAHRQALKAFSQQKGKTRTTSLVFDDEAEFVAVPETESMQTVWVGSGVPLNSAAFDINGYEHDSVVTDDGTGLEITIVCNDVEMDQELTDLRNVLDPRDDLEPEMRINHQLTVAELREVIEEGTDYFHFVGHATPEGLECADGELDVGTVEGSNVEMFCLNACQSFQQGKRLVERGSVSGIVTYSDVSDKYALRTGTLIGQLLDIGFTIGSCHSIVRETRPIGGHYTAVGNRRAALTQPEGGAPQLYRITRREEGHVLEADVRTAPTYEIGSLHSHVNEPDGHHHLVPSTVRLDVGPAELREVLLNRRAAVVDGRLQPRAEFRSEI